MPLTQILKFNVKDWLNKIKLICETSKYNLKTWDVKPLKIYLKKKEKYRYIII